MAPRSTIECLPKEQQERINALCVDKSLTLDRLVDLLIAEMGEDAPSRSALGRYRLKIDEVAANMRACREAVQQLKGEMGDLSDDEQARLNYEMLQGQLFRAQMGMMSGDAKPEEMVKELRQVADALQRLSASRKIDTDRIVRIRQETLAQAAKQVKQKIDGIAADVNALGEEKPDAATILRRIREDVYGVFEEPKK